MISEDIPSESNAVLVYAPSVTFFIVTPNFILFRIWSRVARRSSLGWDDTTIIISFSSALTVQTVMVVSCSYGFGRHIETLTTDDKIDGAQGTIACYMSIASALSIWQCHPLRGAWDKSIQSTCISLNMNWHANAGFSIGTDALDIDVTNAAYMDKSTTRRAQTCTHDGSYHGWRVIVTSIVRMTTLDLATKTLDTTFDISSTMWTIIEQNLAIICTCLPMCRIPIAIILSSCSLVQRNHHTVFLNASMDLEVRLELGILTLGPEVYKGLTRSVVLPNDEASEEVILGS
ncbi:hypothetical protein QL093DRAFT_2075398 [Fusarium oxysporum]|nr:hypothetical protein QL093DRAFT_2075398 [Fusarium oxysporum]